jgi:hypothetical protein
VYFATATAYYPESAKHKIPIPHNDLDAYDEVYSYVTEMDRDLELGQCGYFVTNSAISMSFYELLKFTDGNAKSGREEGNSQDIALWLLWDRARGMKRDDVGRFRVSAL